MSCPITKVVKNDAYTAPRPPAPAAPTRPNSSMAANRASAAALQPVSRTLQQHTAAPSTAALPLQVKASFLCLYCSLLCLCSPSTPNIINITFLFAFTLDVLSQ